MGKGKKDEGNTHASERVVEGLVGSTVEQLTRVQEWGSTDEELMPIGDLTYRSHTSPDAGRFSNPGGLGTLGLDLSVPQHKEDSLEEPNPRVTNGHGPFWEESSLGPKAGPSIVPLNLDLDPCVLKSTLREPPFGPLLGPGK